jgi:uncharacterized protein YndB with AHSA1/START domain
MASEQIQHTTQNIREIPAGYETLIVETDFPGFTPDDLFAHFTEPELLVRWWPQEAEVEPGAGGHYHLSWPGPRWHLRGRHTEWEPGKRLAFTWAWDHDPEGTPGRTVTIEIFPAGEGAGMRLEHGPYSDSAEDQQARQGHVEGWSYFLPKLKELGPARKP